MHRYYTKKAFKFNKWNKSFYPNINFKSVTLVMYKKITRNKTKSTS